MIARAFEAILRPVFDLVAHLMSQLFLAPFRALFGVDEPEDEQDPNDEGAEEPKQLPAPDGPKPESPEPGPRD